MHPHRNIDIHRKQQSVCHVRVTRRGEFENNIQNALGQFFSRETTIHCENVLFSSHCSAISHLRVIQSEQN